MMSDSDMTFSVPDFTLGEYIRLGRKWDVEDIVQYAKYQCKAQWVPAKKLLDNFKHVHTDEPTGSPEFITRALRADLRYAIVVVKEEDNFLSVVDGLHRLWKAIKIYKRKRVKVRILTRSELLDIQHEIGDF